MASRYADILNTHYQDVLEHLEYIRTSEWSKVADGASSGIEAQVSQPDLLSPGFQNESTSSQFGSSSSAISEPPSDCPLYVPGKYNVSRS